MATFPGKKITPALAQEIGSRLSTRIEGRCIKHYMGAAGVKVYDNVSRVLRVETNGLPGGTRTPDPQLRRLVLYPVELRAARPLRAVEF